MAVTLEQIGGFLDSMKLKYNHGKDGSVIVLFSGDDDSIYSHFIRVKDEGVIFEWQMQIVTDDKENLRIKEHKYLSKVLAHLLFLNYQTKFGTWEFDPSDGDIRLAIEIPLEDATMTEKQFNRIASYMLRNGASHAEDIMYILKNGEAPESDEAEMIATLEAMLAKLKGTSSSDTSDGI